MATELAEQLQNSLGASYTIVRELGGGGMSRVFLAEDNALGRSVVFKVLLPDLAAGVNAARFKREVQISARLQHPHIIPVLTAGEVDGLPYYVMPFVKGESLRARIAKGPLPVDETVSILADVAKALAYAHDDGIVHRDIKPDNILLSGGACSVADFGIAKALVASRGGADSDSADSASAEPLTTLGMSIGTPAYMAPEQIVGDPNVDHRADIYALGCVAYEMLAGEAPFAGKSPQQMLAAHVMEAPRPLAERRAGLPPALVALVNACMEKEPSARPQNASEIVSRLSSTGTHEITSPASSVSAPSALATRGSAKKWPVIAAVAAVVAAGGVYAYRNTGTAPATGDGTLTLAVAPFEVLDPSLALWKEGMVDVLSRNLDGAGPIRSIPPSMSINRWEGHGDRTVATEFGKRVKAGVVVYGQVQRAGDLADVRVWVLDVAKGAAPIELQVRDSSARMDRVTDSVSVKVLAALGRTRDLGAARLSVVGSGSLPAIKAFLLGSQYFRRTRWDSAAASFKEAVAHDSTFGVAYLQLGQATGWMRGGGDPEAIAAYKRAGSLVRPGLSQHDSLFLTAIGHYAAVGEFQSQRPGEARQAISTMQTAVDRYPDDAEAWYMLGDIRYHRDPTITDREALAYFDRAIALDSSFAPAYIHAIELAYRYGAEVGGRYADAYLRIDPRETEGEGARLAALVANPRANAKDVQAALDTAPFQILRKASIALQRLPDSSETTIRVLRAAARRAPTPAFQRAMTASLVNQLALRGHVADAWPMAVANRNYAAAEIAGLGLVSPDSALRTLRPFLSNQDDSFLIPIPVLALARDSATLETQRGFWEARLKANAPVPPRFILEYMAGALGGYAALAKGDTASATRLFEAASDSMVRVPFDGFTRARLIGRNDPKRAIALLEQHAASPDLVYAVKELERGRLAERVGDKERAVDAYSFVAAIWRNADAQELRDGAREARDALARLDADGSIRASLVSVLKK